LYKDAADYIRLPVDKSMALFRCNTMQEKIEFLQDYLKNDIVKLLEKRGVELFDFSEDMPKNYTRRTRIAFEEDKPLPSIEGEIGSIHKALEKWLFSHDPIDRKKGFNLAGTMIKDAMDLNDVKEILLAQFTAGNLNEDEQIRAAKLLQEWIDKIKAEKKQYNISFAAEILNNLMKQTPFTMVKLKARITLVLMNDKFKELDLSSKNILINL
jgi:hypothetical protein